ncbi:MAG: DUF1360 domain-containing protein [Burkholderiales bacterium]
MGEGLDGPGVWPALALTSFAVWRVSHLLANEDGPGHLILRLRVRLGDGWAGTLLDCFHCVSLWVSAPFALALTRDPLEWVVAWFGVSGVACVLERVSGRTLAAGGMRTDEGEDDHGMLWTGASGAPEGTRPGEP